MINININLHHTTFTLRTSHLPALADSHQAHAGRTRDVGAGRRREDPRSGRSTRCVAATSPLPFLLTPTYRTPPAQVLTPAVPRGRYAKVAPVFISETRTRNPPQHTAKATSAASTMTATSAPTGHNGHIDHGRDERGTRDPRGACQRTPFALH
jgi:hypothetical protein